MMKGRAQVIGMGSATARTASLALAALVLLAAAAGAQTAPPAAAPAAVAPAPETDFTYNAAGRRDPFKSLLILQEKVKDVSLLPPIQQVDVQSFKVLGVILDPEKGNRAMLQAPDSKTYIIRKGDIIGKNEGEVASIGSDGILVKEKFVDFMNRETIQTTVLKVTTN